MTIVQKAMLSAFVFSTEDNNCKPMSVDVLKRAIKHGLDVILTFTDVLKGHKNLSLNAESEMKTYANARCYHRRIISGQI